MPQPCPVDAPPLSVWPAFPAAGCAETTEGTARELPGLDGVAEAQLHFDDDMRVPVHMEQYVMDLDAASLASRSPLEICTSVPLESLVTMLSSMETSLHRAQEVLGGRIELFAWQAEVDFLSLQQHFAGNPHAEAFLSRGPKVLAQAPPPVALAGSSCVSAVEEDPASLPYESVDWLLVPIAELLRRLSTAARSLQGCSFLQAYGTGEECQW